MVRIVRNHDLFEQPEQPPPPRVAVRHPSPREKFGWTVKRYRMLEKLSRNDVAGATGVREDVIERIEDGRMGLGKTSVADIRKVAHAISCRLIIKNLHGYRATIHMDTVFAKGGKPVLKYFSLRRSGTRSTKTAIDRSFLVLRQ